MSKLNIWNTISWALTGKTKILDSGRELFGTVTKHGVNDKTVTVDVSSRHLNYRYNRYLYNTKSKQVHDEHNYCVTGDKVIIANCNKVSATKAYYVKSIVKAFPRPMTPKSEETVDAPKVTEEIPVSPVVESKKKVAPEVTAEQRKADKFINKIGRPKSERTAARKQQSKQSKAKNEKKIKNSKKERASKSSNKKSGSLF